MNIQKFSNLWTIWTWPTLWLSSCLLGADNDANIKNWRKWTQFHIWGHFSQKHCCGHVCNVFIGADIKYISLLFSENSLKWNKTLESDITMILCFMECISVDRGPKGCIVLSSSIHLTCETTVKCVLCQVRPSGLFPWELDLLSVT